MRQAVIAMLAAIGVIALAGCASTTAGTAQVGATSRVGASALPHPGPDSSTAAAPVDPPQPPGGSSAPATPSTRPAPPLVIPTSPAAGGTMPSSASGPVGKPSTAAAPVIVDGGSAPRLRDDGDAWFQSADGSVRCAIGPSQGDAKPMATCRIAKHSYQVPAAPSANCPHWGDFILLGATGPATFVCYNDPRFDQAASVLPVADSLAFDGFTCQSGTVNVVCQRTDTTEAFTVKPSDYVFWSTTDNSGDSTPAATKPATKSVTPKPAATSNPPTQPATVDGHSAPWNSGGWASFQSPSGNIFCLMGDLSGGGTLSAECEIQHHTYPTPATPASCPLDYGNRFIVSDSKASLGCHGDTLADPDAAVLPYGTSITYGSLACTSSTSGMWCGNLDTGHYFKIASAAYDLG